MKKKLQILNNSIKKSLLFVGLIFMLSGCATMYYWEIGQSRSAFLELNKKNVEKLDLVRHTQQSIIYRAGTEDFLFFYFTNDVLTRVDRGKRMPDIIIQNKH